MSQPILRPGDYSAEALNDRPICVTIDTSPFGVGWAIGQNDNNGNRYAIRFGARVLTERERKYPQVKRELRGLFLALKTDREYLIGVPVIIETDCLPLLGMIFNCDSHDIAMLRWIAYIKTFDPRIKHIKGKDNVVADAISRTIFFNNDTSDPPSIQVETATVLSVHLSEENFSTNITHEGDAAAIVDYLRRASLGQSLANFDRSLRKKAANYFLKDEILWKRPKMDFQSPKRVISKQIDKIYLITAYHDEMWAGHRGTWPTYLKLKEKFYWKNMFKDVENFVRSCQKCQLFITVDIVHMPPGKWGMKYLVLARDDLTNFVEGRCLKTKHTDGVCRFILEEFFSRYGYINTLTADRGELNSNEAKTFFSRLGIKLRLTTAWNPESNGKIERGHQPIVQAPVKATTGRKGSWPMILPFALRADRMTHSSVTGQMPVYLMNGGTSIFPTDYDVLTWFTLPWTITSQERNYWKYV